MKKTSKKSTDSNPAKEQPTEASPVMVKAEILVHRTKVGSCVCAKGAVLSISKERADALVSAELAKIVGI